ncbi:tRNA ligase [Parelaphostrongylus tenuis]|uniref:tRNA ligase n=1 Tax=Parelaphostrongylus tenuis TaxID=148309 RepID=A0AAD5QV44_PARTN|nr:tRNA ligase [Parelaphostrongylus tenuis]
MGLCPAKKPGEPAELRVDCETLKIAAMLTEFFAKVITFIPNGQASCVDLCVNQSGPAYEDKKVELIKAFIVYCRGSNKRFTVRPLEGKLRIALAEQSVLVALVDALTSHDVKEGGSQFISSMLKELRKKASFSLKRRVVGTNQAKSHRAHPLRRLRARPAEREAVAPT